MAPNQRIKSYDWQRARHIVDAYFEKPRLWDTKYANLPAFWVFVSCNIRTARHRIQQIVHKIRHVKILLLQVTGKVKCYRLLYNLQRCRTCEQHNISTRLCWRRRTCRPNQCSRIRIFRFFQISKNM